MVLCLIDSKKPKRGQKLERHFSPKRNIVTRDETLKEQGDLIGIEQDQLPGLNTTPNAAMATVTRSKRPTHSLETGEETCVASDFESTGE